MFGSQDPNIRRMTEAIAQDPMFQEMAKEMQESMLAGGMGGLNLGERGAEESEDAGTANAGSGGAAGPGMPAIDPTKYMEAMQRVMQNPEFMAAAESLGKGLLSQSMSPDDIAMLEVFQNPANQEALKSRLEGLKEDPELADVMKDIEENGQGALMKYMNDPEIMSKVGRKFQEAMSDPEFRAQLRGAEMLPGHEDDEDDEEDEEEEFEETIINLASAGLVDRLKELLAEDGADADERDEEGRTALHFAAGYSELEAMRALLDAGADVNAKDQNSNTALHYAAGYGNQDAARVLLDGGADVKVTNAEGKTAAEVAQMNEHNDLAKMLETTPAQ